MSILSTTELAVGIIPFDSNDPSVVVNCTMKSSAAVVAAGGTEVGSPTYSDNGMTNESSANHVLFDSPAGYAALTHAGQISYKVPIEFISSEDGGFHPAVNSYILTASDVNATNSTPFTRHWKASTTDALVMQADSVDDQNAILTSALDTQEYVTVTESWIGGTSQKFIDGRLQNTTPITRNNFDVADRYKYIWCGADRGNTVSSQLYGYPISDVVVATKPVMIPKHPVFSKTVIIGHSFVAGGDPFPTSGYYGWDKSIGRCAKGYLTDKGLFTTNSFHATSGAVLDSNLSATNLDADFTAAVAERPTCAIIIAGTNDVSNVGFDADQFDTEYKSYIDDLVATCEIIIVTTVPSSIGNTPVNTPTVVGNKVAANVKINALPAYNSKCVVSDLDSLLGDETTGSDYWEGEFNGTWTDRHPTPRACRLIGEDIGEKIFNSL